MAGAFFESNDFRAMDLGTPRWTALRSSGTGTPRGRDGHGMVGLGGRVFMFGGKSVDTAGADRELLVHCLFAPCLRALEQAHACA